MDQALTDEHQPDRRPHAEGGEHGSHPSDSTYIKVALLLSVLTGIEITLSYTNGLSDSRNIMLLILAAMKFGLVVLFFMHLRFDNRIFRRLFVAGFILALIVYTLVLFMFHVLP
jgi:caa(3)-type oxidase subunit IV